MKRKKKSQKKSCFPNFLKLSCHQTGKNTLIITDAGHDQISYQLALQFFSFETIIEWWRFFEEEYIFYEEVEAKLPLRYESISQEESLKIIEELLIANNWLPQEVTVLTAKAIYQEWRWLMFIDLSSEWTSSRCFDMYEEIAIKLGNHLKQEIGNQNLIIVNDNQHAVKTMNGFSFDVWLLDRDYAKELAQQTYSVLWTGRDFVKRADRLKADKANRLFPPDALDD